MVNRTIFGEPVGKYQLGTSDDSGHERALLGKFIGEEPSVSLSTLDIRIPERQRLVVSSAGDVVLGVLIGFALTRIAGR